VQAKGNYRIPEVVEVDALLLSKGGSGGYGGVQRIEVETPLPAG